MLAPASGCELDVQRGPDWLLVRIRNLNLDSAEMSRLAEQLGELLRQHFTYRLVLELDEVPTLNQDLVEQLRQLYRWIERHDGVMRICGLSQANRRRLHACHLDERLLPYEDCHEAVLGFPWAPKPR